MGYLVKNKNERHNIWKPDLEALAALFAISIEINRGEDRYKVCKFLNQHFLRKTDSKNFNPTKFQKTILEENGY